MIVLNKVHSSEILVICWLPEEGNCLVVQEVPLDREVGDEVTPLHPYRVVGGAARRVSLTTVQCTGLREGVVGKELTEATESMFPRPFSVECQTLYLLRKEFD